MLTIVCLKLGSHQVAEVHVTIVHPNNQSLYAAQRAETLLELLSELIEGHAAPRGLRCDRLDHGEHVAYAVLQFGHQDLLAILQGAQIMYVCHGPNPVDRSPVAVVDRACPGLVPSILAVFTAPNAMFKIVFAGLFRFLLSRNRAGAIIRMDSVQPASAEAFFGIQACKVDPLRAWPRAGAVA